MLTLMNIEHELLLSLDFTDTVKEFALAKTRKNMTTSDATTAVQAIGAIASVVTIIAITF